MGKTWTYRCECGATTIFDEYYNGSCDEVQCTNRRYAYGSNSKLVKNGREDGCGGIMRIRKRPDGSWNPLREKRA